MNRLSHLLQSERMRAPAPLLLLGLFLRLLLMPFSAHNDLINTYWHAHLIAYHQRYVFNLQTLVRYFHAAYLRVITPILPSSEILWFHGEGDVFASPFFSAGEIVLEGWLRFIRSPYVYRAFFLFKLPYLLFDLGCLFLLHLILERNEGRDGILLWWLNPILLFAIYTFGRHEVITLFFIFLSIYFIKREQPWGGLFALGVAIAVRYYALLLLPIYVLSLYRNWKDWLRGLLLGLAPWCFVNLIVWYLGEGSEAGRLLGVQQGNHLLAARLPLGPWDNLYIFPLFYFLLLLHRLYNRSTGLTSLRRYSLVALLLLFATSYMAHPHYWTWFLPFLALEVVENRQLLPLHAVQVLSLAGYSFIGGRPLAGYLFAPIVPDFFWSLPSPIELLGRVTSPEMVVSMARTVFGAVTLWMAWLIFRTMEVRFSSDSDLDGEEV